MTSAGLYVRSRMGQGEEMITSRDVARRGKELPMRDARPFDGIAIVALGFLALHGWAAAGAPAPRTPDQPTHERTGPFAVPGVPEQLAVAPDGSFIFVHDRKDNITLFRPDGSLIRHLPDTFPYTALSPDGKILAAVSKDRLLFYSMPDAKQVAEWKGIDATDIVAFGRGDVLVGCCPHKLTPANENWTVRLWRYPGGKQLSSFEVKGTYMYDTVLSPDGSLLAWDDGRRDRVVHVWDCQAGKEVARFANEKCALVRLAFSPDSKYLATGGSMKRLVNIWDVKTKKLVRRLDGEGEKGIYALAFAPDGSILASGEHQTVSFWDVKEGKLLRRTDKPLQRNDAAYPNVESIAFFPDGKTIVTGHTDEVLRLWEVGTAKEITPGTKAKKD
jgi:WD40 repeat protein